MAHGSILYSGPINTELSGSSAYQVDLDQDFTFDYTVRFDGASGNNQLKPFIDARSAGNANAWVLSKPNGGAPLTLFGTNIDSTYAGNFPTNKVGYLYEQYDNNTVVGDWPSTADTEGYVGVAITDGVTSTNYGWVHLIYKAASTTTKTLVVVDYAYETTPNTPIIAGAITTPAEPLIACSTGRVTRVSTCSAVRPAAWVCTSTWAGTKSGNTSNLARSRTMPP